MRGAKVASKTTVATSIATVTARRAKLSRFESLEDLHEAAYGDAPDEDAVALAFHLQAIRNKVAEALWLRQVFIGPSVLDDLLFHAAKDVTVVDPLAGAFEYLRDLQANRPGMIVFPLHSVGVLGAGLLGPSHRPRAQFIHPEWGLALTPQTNDVRQTVAFLEQARDAFRIRKPLDAELFAHWHRTRARWLKRNPLLAISFVSQRGSYYDTEFLVVARVRAAISVLMMVSTFQPPQFQDASRLFSSSAVNNWETLDIHHYVVLADNPARRRTLDGDCVPIHERKGDIAELSDLSMEIDPSYVPRRHALFNVIESAVAEIFTGYLCHVTGARDDAVVRAQRRMFEALSFYRRSFHGSGRSWAATVSLATAYEMLLTDHYNRGVAERLKRRVALVLRGVRGTKRYQEAFADLYDARGALVHAGAPPDGVDLRTAQQGFVHIFRALAQRTSGLELGSHTPMRDLTGDRTNAGEGKAAPA